MVIIFLGCALMITTLTSCGDTSIGGDTVQQQGQEQDLNEPEANCNIECTRNVTTGEVVVATQCEATGSTTVAVLNSLPDNCSRVDEVVEVEDEEEVAFNAEPLPTPGLQDGVI